MDGEGHDINIWGARMSPSPAAAPVSATRGAPWSGCEGCPSRAADRRCVCH
uniref:Mating-type pheromone BAP1(1) n=1 Tax=Schizophyllum commune TaxID=5334 RepID=BAP11_SCHCO|nr:RecName: Full=Mating-type pheromone BAP1(1); Flags: Precursor [Schizophyllum commune]